MNPIQSRFSSVQELRQSNLDIPALKANGQLEVDGKRYEIQAANDGTIAVLRPEQQSRAKSFFKGVSQLVGGSSQRAQIAQVLNEKAASTRTALHQSPVPDRRFDNLERGESSSAATAIKPTARQAAQNTFDSFHEWARQAEKLPNPSRMDIYKIYKNDAPHSRPMSEEQQEEFLRTLKALNGKHGIEVRSQDHDKVANKKDRNLDKYIAESPNAKTFFYRITPRHERREGKHQGRLTIGVQPEYATQLTRAMAALIEKESAITQGKVIGPACHGQMTDSAVLYINGDLAKAEKLGNKLKQMSGIPPEAFIEHTPMSMQSLSTGLSYAESILGDVRGHGMSRAEVISDALQMDGLPFLARLKLSLAANGYDPDNPALRNAK
ncbi:Type III effector HopA1 [Pseudomonas syringae pv. helianthi]|uniref:Type III effector HopA1 n=1 Tax=Pseudomonas syringae pv. helianthi TaxID=251654 RepID=A0A3M6D2V7_9PSED|nr:T3SS effector HopA1 family protein [Pseudomonas syringae group genomosp. 7]RMV49846.1 Type III effector HopA1 [Pseudomonas syringae pv. helianthi]